MTQQLKMNVWSPDVQDIPNEGELLTVTEDGLHVIQHPEPCHRERIVSWVLDRGASVVFLGKTFSLYGEVLVVVLTSGGKGTIIPEYLKRENGKILSIFDLITFKNRGR